MKYYLIMISLMFCGWAQAQSTVTGTVTDSNKQPIPGANVKVQSGDSGTTTDADGKFKLTTTKKPPFKLEISSVGFGNSSQEIKSDNQDVSIVLRSEEMKLDEIVVSASRTAERVKESPVTIERMGVKDIKKTASPSFYDGLENLKEVHMNTSSLAFKSINTRGFATVANTRFMQLVDGMDNSSPLLNFVLGNMIGVSELDVQSVELLPGASSALYGANAFNGILFMNSKSPFTSQGVSAYVKYGQTNQSAAGANNFYDYGIRVAHAFCPRFATKANFTFLKGTDWLAVNYDDKFRQGEGFDRTDPNYDGINVYGDEVATNIKAVAPKLYAAGAITDAQLAAFNAILPDVNVSRTGYRETDLTDNKVTNAKADMSLHFKPFANDFEIIWQSKFGFGNAVYQGASRYYLNNFFMQQHKLEFKGKNFFVRGYTTTEDGGNSYDMLFTGINVNRQWKEDKVWFGEYAGAYVQGTLGGMTPQQAHNFARQKADTGRLIPGSPEFKAAFNKVISEADVTQGSKLVDNSRIYHSDINYNFKDIIKFAEIQIGGSYREYQLNSFGRIYTDDDGPIYYTDYGAYTQVTKKLLEDRLKFTGSARYDKSKNFDGNVSPRLSLVYSAGENRNHNFRASFQTGFRNPSTQEQYIGFNIGNIVLIGSAKDNLTRYSETLPVAEGSPAVGQIYAQGDTAIMTGVNAYDNSYTAASVQAFSNFLKNNPGNTPGAAALLRKTNVDYVKPEQVKAFEVGYRGQLKDFTYDLSAYYNTYTDFIGNLNVIAPYYGKATQTFDFTFDAPNYLNNPEVQSLHALGNENYRVYQLYTNTDVEIKSFGFGAGFSKKLPANFEFGANYNYAQFDFDQAKDPSFEAGFNTPKHRVKASISNDKLFKNFGFNLSGRWNSEYRWESTMVDGTIEENVVVDAQINYSIPKLKSVIKLGAANLGGKDYTQVLGAGLVGQQYFASWTINP
ncbi:TonB-dependent receptor [Flavobacterium sp. CYK-55]|uniref:TonB-dependent receptor domain-containing protein n=1 Tax=Flavobacterium sp. CYK-55 TaxID=2835529 RepID=UPI001BCD9D8F|nr:TonB-dependent receptor [Flavobacterium sp. CYK-55]MBS7787799.1 TonB-dependent receptor [Flavobacterium sp. CYK-55]